MERPGDDALLRMLPVPALHLRGGEVKAANPRARRLLGSPDEVLSSMHSADSERLVAAVGAVSSRAGPDVFDDDPAASGPVMVRLGASPPHRFVEVHLGPHPDGGALAVVHDVTERERLDAAIAEVATGVYFTDAGLRVTWIGEKVGASVGLPPAAFVGSEVYDLVHPDDVASTRQLAALATERPGVRCSRKIRVRHPEQPDVWWPIVVHTVWRPGDAAIGGFSVRFDMDLAAGVHHQSAEETAQSLVTLGSSSMTGALHLDLEGRLLQRSTRVREILRPVGADGDERWLELLGPEHREAVEDQLEAARGGTPLPAVEVSFVGEGSLVWVRLDVLPYRNTQGEVAGMFVSVMDLTAEHEAREELALAREDLWMLANHDALTGLANRYQLTDRLHAALDAWIELGRAGGEARPAVVVCDLDRFKVVNDLHGHRVGDDVLVEAARRIGAAVDEDGVVCRFGGDEFVVVCEAVTVDGLRVVVDRVIESFAAPMVLEDLTLDVGISVGSALAEPHDATDPDTLVLRADRAMYVVKAEHRSAHRAS